MGLRQKSRPADGLTALSPLNKLRAIFDDPQNAARLAEALEHEPANLPDGYVSPLVGDPAAVQWYRARKALSFFAWDIYAAAAITHYRAVEPERPAPLMNTLGAVMSMLPEDLIQPMEDAYLRCKEVAWRDQRPEGYSFDPFKNDFSEPEHRDKLMTHREMSPEMETCLNRALAALSPKIEKTLGHYWSAGAARLFSHKPGKDGGIHTDGWPLSVRKIMIYPSGAGPEQGSTTIQLRDGKVVTAEGGKGVWVIFENSQLKHMAQAPKPAYPPRPTIEITIMPAFRTDPVIKGHGIHVGYPWLPPDIEGLSGDKVPYAFTSREIKERALLRSLMLALDLPDKGIVPAFYQGLGYRDT